MIKHLIGIVAVVAAILFCTLLPFLPGRYDSLAIPISSLVQVAGVVGVLLIPSGLLLIAADRSPRLNQWRRAFAMLAVSAWLLVGAVVCLVGVAQSGFTLGIAAATLWLYAAVKLWRAPKTIPFYLVAVPIAVVLLQLALVKPAVEYSRNRAILSSAPLIAAIEQHRNTHGRYPASLLSVHADYSPNVVGIPHYHYEPHGEGYNLVFEQFTNELGVREFVVYNPRDEHVMTSHAIDILELTPQRLALERTRGHNFLFDTQHQHWKYFWFD